jgi:hypothetical protein
MNDIFQIFEKPFQDLEDSIKNMNFYRSSNISSDLISLSVLSDYPDGILIGTVLEEIFSRMEDLFEQYEISEKDANIITKEYSEHMGTLSKSYREDDKNKVYEVLRDLSTITMETEFKYTRFKKGKDEVKRLNFGWGIMRYHLLFIYNFHTG